LGVLKETFFGQDKVVAAGLQPLYYDPVGAGFSLRLLAQLESCGYLNLLRKLKLAATFRKSKLLSFSSTKR